MNIHERKNRIDSILIQVDSLVKNMRIKLPKMEFHDYNPNLDIIKLLKFSQDLKALVKESENLVLLRAHREHFDGDIIYEDHVSIDLVRDCDYGKELELDKKKYLILDRNKFYNPESNLLQLVRVVVTEKD